jgi:glycosyltransferase involved in cell wall biosynthesis
MSGESARAPSRVSHPQSANGDGGWTPRRVLFLTPRWARDGGVGAHVVASAAALAQRGVEVLVLVAKVDSDERIPGVGVLAWPKLLDRATAARTRLEPALGWSADVAHLHQVDDPQLVRALGDAAPVVISAHGYTACTSGVHYFRPGHECARAHGPGCVPNLVACAHLRDPRALPRRYREAGLGLHALRDAHMAISYSSAVDRHLGANGIGHRAIVPYFPTIPVHEQTGDADARRVVFAGRVIAAKGVGVLVRAAARVDAEFVICGDGRALEQTRRLARRLGVSERVRFTGWLSPRELGAELASASVVALPSVWPEPFGIVGIEGHAAGKPAVASATGGVRDWLEHEISGLVVKPGDSSSLAGALEQLLADPQRSRAMGAAGKRAVAASFSAQRHVQALIETYRAARQRREARSLATTHQPGATLAAAAAPEP